MPYVIKKINEDKRVTEDNRKLVEAAKPGKVFFDAPNSLEALREQKKLLNGMLALIKANEMAAGSLQYNYIENILNTSVTYCDSLFLNATGQGTEKDANASYEGLAAMFELISSQALAYMVYKESNMDSARDTSNEVNRIYAAYAVHDMARDMAELMENTINSEREKDMLGEKDQGNLYAPKKDNYQVQYRKLDELEKELAATADVFHGSGEKFKTMMTQLGKTKESLEKALQAGDAENNYQEYIDSVAKLQQDVRAYRDYKRYNNNFGSTSINRMMIAEKLDKALGQIMVPVQAMAEKWFADMSEKLKAENIDITNPFTAAGVVILDDIEASIADHDKYKTSDYKKGLKLANDLAKSRHMAFAKIDRNANPAHPYDFKENMADWINRECPHSEKEFTPEHKLHLYNMARQNRLFVYRVKDVAIDDLIEKRIAVNSKNECEVQVFTNRVGGDGKFIDKEDYKKLNLTDEQLQEINRRSFKANFGVSVKVALQDARSASTELSEAERIKLNQGSENYFTDMNIVAIAEYYPEWFLNKDDAHEISEMVRIDTDPGHVLSEQDKATIEKAGTFWTIANLKQSKKFLEKLGVSSFTELLNSKMEIKNSDGKVIEAENSYRLAKKIFTDLVHKKDILVGGRRFELRGGINEVQPVAEKEAEAAKKYIEGLEKWSEKIIDLFVPEEARKNVKENYSELEKWFNNHKTTEFDNTFKLQCFNIRKSIIQLKEDRKLRNRPISFSDIEGAVKNFMPLDRMGMLGQPLRNMKTISDDILGKLRIADEYYDLMDKMKRGIAEPFDEKNDLERRVAARIVTIASERSIKLANVKADNMTEEDKEFRKEAVSFLLNPKKRSEIVEIQSNCKLIRNAVENGTLDNLMKMSDSELANAFRKSEMEEIKQSAEEKQDIAEKNAHQNNIDARQNAELNV